MKKILSLALVAFMAVSLASCKSKEEKAVSELESIVDAQCDVVDRLSDWQKEYGDMDEDDFSDDEKERVEKALKKMYKSMSKMDF